MKNVQKKLLILVTIAAMLLSLPGKIFSQDAVTLMPGMHKILLDNDDVKVYEAIYKPGDKVPMHSHPKHIVYVMSGGKMTFTNKEGKKEERITESGKVMDSPPVSHMTENTGDTEIKVLVVELKHAMDHKMMDKKKM